jgi:hypothetical protein
MNYQYCNAKTGKSNEGMLKKAASGVLAILPCSRTGKYAPRVKIAAALLDNFFDHSRRTPDSEFFCGLYGLFARNIQQAQ